MRLDNGESREENKGKEKMVIKRKDIETHTNTENYMNEEKGKLLKIRVKIVWQNEKENSNKNSSSK